MKRFFKNSRLLSIAAARMGFRKQTEQPVSFALVFETFQKTLTLNNRILALIAGMGDKLGGDYVFDNQYIQSECAEAALLTHELIVSLNTLAPQKYLSLFDTFQTISDAIKEELAGRPVIPKTDAVMPYSRITRDLENVAGAKNANLGEIRNMLGLTVPEGFAITSQAFDAYMSGNHLWEKVAAITRAWQNEEIPSEQASQEIQALISGGDLPGSLKKAIFHAVDRLSRKTGETKLFLAIRSSAWGEDSGHSFAGQYLSILNTPVENLTRAYKDVLASAYDPSAMEYRRHKGFSESEVVMAVGCQCMISPRVSGVLYTFDPQAPERDVMLITSLWGLGAPIVDGRMAADQYRVNRQFPHEQAIVSIAHKKEKLTPRAEGGTELSPVPEEDRSIASLTPKQLQLLAQSGLMIERHFKKPSDIEFAFDQNENLVILQARPLNIKMDRSQMVKKLPAILETAPVLFSKKGFIAQGGIAIGKVFMIHRDEDLDEFPPGAILVAKFTSPRFAKAIRKVAGIITDVGSETGHMATIAREFRVPTIVNTEIATQVLKSGQEITLDAEENIVYDGMIRELRNYHLTENPIEEAFEYRLLRRILKKIAPLNLIDPSATNFVPSGCRTIHDITRFVHEKAVEELINQQYYHHHDPNTVSGKLKLSVPLDLVLIDIADGLAPDVKSAAILPEQIASIPMRAFLEGLVMPGAWSNEPMSVDLGSFMSSMTRTFSAGMATPKEIGQNLAVISKPFAHISLRLGYHFNMIDAYITDNSNDNYVYFRFMGGVTDPAKRSRRAQFLAEVLSKNDFRVEVQGDLVVARIKKLTSARMTQKIYLLGVLVAFSRQLDVQMLSDQHIAFYAENFHRLIDSNLNPNKNEGNYDEH
ncbi:MAG: PEP-utilizing enzyme [Desulfobacteraceae bacterium]|nr:PEP-utilizing enzyme [Desulfobacteraceae bacterium]